MQSPRLASIEKRGKDNCVVHHHLSCKGDVFIVEESVTESSVGAVGLLDPIADLIIYMAISRYVSLGLFYNPNCF